jgi:lipoyl synthase
LNNIRKPKWLASKTKGSLKSREILRKLRSYNLHTVCESAKCPNRGECFDRGTATFMILGSTCTRNCTFCAVDKNSDNLFEPDILEPENIAKIVNEMNLKHVVITTVTRDDLTDGGAEQFVKVIQTIREKCSKEVSIEVLISDLQGNDDALQKILDAKPDILNHNVETIQRLYSQVRPMADYNLSLNLLKKAKKENILTKSGFMVGLGETKQEIIKLMEDLKKSKVDIVTIGQYIAPSANHYPVKEYIHPDIFSEYKQEGIQTGFQLVESGPLVRSSYFAERAKEFIKS